VFPVFRPVPPACFQEWDPAVPQDLVLYPMEPIVTLEEDRANPTWIATYLNGNPNE
jgi:hypothetical protein